MSSSQDTSTDQTSHNAKDFDKKHLAIALGIGLSIVAIIIMCLLYGHPELYITCICITVETNGDNAIDSPSLSTVAITNVVVRIANQNEPPARNACISSTRSSPVVPSSTGGPKPKFLLLLLLLREQMGISSGMFLFPIALLHYTTD